MPSNSYHAIWARRWRAKNPDARKRAVIYQRARTVQQKFGISMDEYNARLAAQNGLCALCKKPFTGTGKADGSPALDHNHNTGALRKFVHNRCNKGLGHFYDDLSILQLAVEYLESFEN